MNRILNQTKMIDNTKISAKEMKESKLYPPLKRYLEQQGYEVKGEVENCDVVAIRNQTDIIVIELKLSLNLTVILQSIDRLTITHTVYIGIPKGIAVLKKNRKRVIKLIRMLGLGLIVIDPKSKIGCVDILCNPGEYKPHQVKNKTQILLREFQQRIGDPNHGGTSTRRGIITAYRQKALAIAEYLQENGKTKASIISKSLSEPKVRNILYDNHYGWFKGLGKGVYTLSQRGNSEITEWLERNNKKE